MQVSFGTSAKKAARRSRGRRDLSRIQQRLRRHGRMADREAAERQDASLRDHPALEYAHRSRCGTRRRKIDRPHAGGDAAQSRRRLPCRLCRRRACRAPTKQRASSRTKKRGASTAERTIRTQSTARRLTTASKNRQESSSALPGEGDLIEHLGAEPLRGARDRAAAERAIEFDRRFVVGQRPHHHALQSALRHVLARG